MWYIISDLHAIMGVTGQAFNTDLKFHKGVSQSVSNH